MKTESYAERDQRERKEIVDMLKVLNTSARGAMRKNTLIVGVCLESLEWVIEQAIIKLGGGAE